MTHTPGPWKAYDDDEGNGFTIEAGRNGIVAEGLDETNASLIAAAPDLLAACRATIGVFEGHDDVPLYVSKARAAIAKAEGTS